MLWMPDQEWRVFPRGRAEAGISVWADHRLPDAPERLSRDGEVHAAIAGWSVHHFADTAPMRRAVDPADHHELAEDGGNLAAVPTSAAPTPPLYQQILAAPGSSSARPRRPPPRARRPRQPVRLQWRQTGDPHLFQPAQLADGALRFLALATVLLQPEPPATLVLDEPDLGLHPLALRRLAGLLHAASARAQLIIATQSPELVRSFDPEDIILVQRRHGASELQRMTAPALAEWRKQHDPRRADRRGRRAVSASPTPLTSQDYRALSVQHAGPRPPRGRVRRKALHALDLPGPATIGYPRGVSTPTQSVAGRS